MTPAHAEVMIVRTRVSRQGDQRSIAAIILIVGVIAAALPDGRQALIAATSLLKSRRVPMLPVVVTAGTLMMTLVW